ncbi:MAG: GT4 family glycosyltransferase PelF [Sciscionella sp.]|nr:GT4 family glycosyltransferase PelF [Sciscionella sp.]
MEVALISEGTYPHMFGGVSVWCDQLVRGMVGYDYSFHVIDLLSSGTEPVVWELPDNVASVANIPLWGQPSARRPPGRLARRVFRELLAEFVDVLLAPCDAHGRRRFAEVLPVMFEYAQAENLTASMASEDAVRVLSGAWRDLWADGDASAPSLRDALIALQLLEHALRPLSAPPVEVDVLHAVTNGLGALPALTAHWRYGTPMIVTEHGIYLREQYINGRRGPYRWPVKALYLAFIQQLCALGYAEAELIAPGNAYNQRWERRMGAVPEAIKTVYNGVDPGEFPAVAGEPESPTISWAGRVDPIKDLETLLHAFSLVRKEIPDARLRVFGGSPKGRESYLHKCQALAEKLGVDGAATFEGRVDEIRDAYVAGHVVALSSISEGFPYTLIEAMVCGRPCVATDVGGVSEAVADTGFVVPPRDPEAMARACLKLLQDKELRTRLGTAARDRALAMFTVDRAISTYDEIYSFVGSGRRLPAVAALAESGEPPTLTEEIDALWGAAS